MAAGEAGNPNLRPSKKQRTAKKSPRVESEDDLESGDVCQSLMQRYAGSAAPQHRHLCAYAAAMRSFLVEEGIPLTPAAYFLFAVSSICDSGGDDRETLSAVSAFLSVLAPLVPPRSISSAKAGEAASSLISLLENLGSEEMAGPTVRSLVGSLGVLALCVDLGDWDVVELPLRTLLRFSVEKRPKVRRCAQLSVVEVFRALKCPIIVEKSSKMILSLFQNIIPLAMKLSLMRNDSKREKQKMADDIHVLHVLGIIKLLVAHMPLKFSHNCFPEICKLLKGKFSLMTRNVIGLLESVLQRISDDILEREAENAVLLLTSYLSSESKNPADTLCSASTLLKDTMETLHNSQTEIWVKHLPLVYKSVAGLLISFPSIGEHCASIMRELISVDHFPGIGEICGNSADTSESSVIISLCSSCENVLSASSTAPKDYMLSVISHLFLKLGKQSSLYMSKILQILSSLATTLDEGTNELQSVQQCLGSAVFSMGPENILSILPISFDQQKKTYSNMHLFPILKKHTIGASLKFFVEHVIPLARSTEDKCNTLHRSSVKKKHMSFVNALWSLLPAFCHYPTDTADNFGSLTNILAEKLKKDPSSHDLVSTAIMELVNGNKKALKDNIHISSDIMKDKCEVKSGYPVEVAQKNIEVLASHSVQLFNLYVDMFFDSPADKRGNLKDIIGCLASLRGSLDLPNFFSSLLVQHSLVDVSDRGEELENFSQSSNNKMEEQTRLVLELASTFVGVADQDFIIILFDYIKPHLLDDAFCQLEAYQILSGILKVNSWFVVSQFDQLMDLLIGLESTVELSILSCRLACLHFMLVHLLKENVEKTNDNALILLNEILRFIKDPSEEVRKAAFDTLIDITQSLKNSENSTSEVHLRHLFQMIMGYFSGSPPQTVSMAIAAISLLIYKDAQLYYFVPDLMPTVLVLLQNKAPEVTKAVLGLIKVMVTSLPKTEIRNLLPDLINGILPWSSVSKNHFRSKVKSLVEILNRKCSIDAVLLHVPENYKGFIKQVIEFKQKERSEGTTTSNIKSHPKDSSNSSKHSRALDSKGKHKKDGMRKRYREHPVRTGQEQGGKRKRFGSSGFQKNKRISNRERNQS